MERRKEMGMEIYTCFFPWLIGIQAEIRRIWSIHGTKAEISGVENDGKLEDSCG